MKQIVNEPVSISIEPVSRFLLLKQGENEARLTKNDVAFVKKVLRGESPEPYISRITGIKLSICGEDKNQVLLTDNEENTILLKKRKKGFNDLTSVDQYMERHRANIAWDRDFRYK